MTWQPSALGGAMIAAIAVVRSRQGKRVAEGARRSGQLPARSQRELVRRARAGRVSGIPLKEGGKP